MINFRLHVRALFVLITLIASNVCGQEEVDEWTAPELAAVRWLPYSFDSDKTWTRFALSDHRFRRSNAGDVHFGPRLLMIAKSKSQVPRAMFLTAEGLPYAWFEDGAVTMCNPQQPGELIRVPAVTYQFWLLPDEQPSFLATVVLSGNKPSRIQLDLHSQLRWLKSQKAQVSHDTELDLFTFTLPDAKVTWRQTPISFRTGRGSNTHRITGELADGGGSVLDFLCHGESPFVLTLSPAGVGATEKAVDESKDLISAMIDADFPETAARDPGFRPSCLKLLAGLHPAGEFEKRSNWLSEQVDLLHASQGQKSLEIMETVFLPLREMVHDQLGAAPYNEQLPIDFHRSTSHLWLQCQFGPEFTRLCRVLMNIGSSETHDREVRELALWILGTLGFPDRLVSIEEFTEALEADKLTPWAVWLRVRSGLPKKNDVQRLKELAKRTDLTNFERVAIADGLLAADACQDNIELALAAFTTDSDVTNRLVVPTLLRTATLAESGNECLIQLLESGSPDSAEIFSHLLGQITRLEMLPSYGRKASLPTRLKAVARARALDPSIDAKTRGQAAQLAGLDLDDEFAGKFLEIALAELEPELLAQLRWYPKGSSEDHFLRAAPALLPLAKDPAASGHEEALYALSYYLPKDQPLSDQAVLVTVELATVKLRSPDLKSQRFGLQYLGWLKKHGHGEQAKHLFPEAVQIVQSIDDIKEFSNAIYFLLEAFGGEIPDDAPLVGTRQLGWPRLEPADLPWWTANRERLLSELQRVAGHATDN